MIYLMALRVYYFFSGEQPPPRIRHAQGYDEDYLELDVKGCVSYDFQELYY